MCEHTVDELAGHLGGVLRVIVESGDGRKDGCSSFGGELHVAKVNAVEGSLAHAEDERSALLEADVGGALDEICSKAVGDGGEGSHGAGKDDHAGGGIASAGDTGADIGFAVLAELFAGRAEELFGEVVASAEAELFGDDAQRVFRCDEVNVRDAVVGGEGAQHLRGIDAATGSGNGEDDAARFGHSPDYRR